MYAWEKRTITLTKYPYFPQLLDAQCHLESAALTNDALCPNLGSISSAIEAQGQSLAGLRSYCITSIVPFQPLCATAG